jgi:hypothetical protein
MAGQKGSPTGRSQGCNHPERVRIDCFRASYCSAFLISSLVLVSCPMLDCIDGPSADRPSACSFARCHSTVCFSTRLG